MDKVNSRLQHEIREQIEDEMLAASVIMEMRTAVEGGNEEYARGYLDGMGLAIGWKAAQWENFKRSHPEITRQLGNASQP